MKKNRLFFTEKYLQARPAFFGLIRPIEADLMYKNRNLLGKKVLDFGCGDGFFADMIFGKNGLSVGLDVPSSIIVDAKDKKVYKKVQLYDGEIIPYKDGSFDSVVSNSVLEHVPNLKGNLKEIHRIMKPEGYFLTTVMTKRWDDYLLGSTVFGKRYSNWLKKDQDHKNLLSEKKWKKYFLDAGFEIEKTIGYLDKDRSNLLEIWHYLSIPSILTKKIFNSWVLWKSWYKIFSLDKQFEEINTRSFVSDDKASSIFFVLKKSK